ncbi:MAG: hypothetical protein B7Y36_08405 [Novosphingobium sp. 28-62-57]|uniref:hypothetical protein n=1 Tax=unclassified Novosphingobium TaxID=2644732 RepID=UPI000BDDCD9E|nr:MULTISPECIES: hypothetical protein [unclassified Novosphingobium]OYW47945.1 MAG: hypothetical protein B7Z36_01495 [Novosphingobium sp. 12-63-9]OYZ10838.1 MAG: hypothetical protein B7Y36_08405 [Novosphingobium sp. 28-62-57]OZA32851.1 MAG: hypothetical protein B7X92_12115 [Novosphingobium sp. 17-62-9]HQS70029.1 hypothetical protein [Novosphingobium sp.]
MFRALERRAQEGDLEALEALASLRHSLKESTERAGLAASQHGYSFTEIGAALGITRQAARHRLYPSSVQLGKMTQEEADYQIALIDAMIDDVTRWGRYLASPRVHRTAYGNFRDPAALTPKTHSFTWHQRRAAITHELEYRARVYPDWIARGKLEQAEADRATRRLSAVADLYDDGFDWHARNGLRILFNVTPTTAAETEAQTDWWHHYRTVMQARGFMASDQKELAL